MRTQRSAGTPAARRSSGTIGSRLLGMTQWSGSGHPAARSMAARGRMSKNQWKMFRCPTSPRSAVIPGRRRGGKAMILVASARWGRLVAWSSGLTSVRTSPPAAMAVHSRPRMRHDGSVAARCWPSGGDRLQDSRSTPVSSGSDPSRIVGHPWRCSPSCIGRTPARPQASMSCTSPVGRWKIVSLSPAGSAALACVSACKA